MREILLTQGQVALVDDGDYEAVSPFKWFAEKRTHGFYAARNIDTPKGRRLLRMHNAILGLKLVDHHNGNGLDNRRLNLRSANKSQNGANAALSRRNKSGLKGVSLFVETGQWRAVIQNTYLGLFAAKEEAAEAYRRASDAVFGEFAKP